MIMYITVDSKSELCYDKHTKGQSSEMQAVERGKRKEAKPSDIHALDSRIYLSLCVPWVA